MWQHEEHIEPLTELRTAIFCALTAACYDNRVRGLGLGPPRLWSPGDELATAGCEPDGARLVRQERWI